MSAASTNRILLVLEALAGFGVVAAIVGKNYGPAPTVAFMAAAMATAFAAWMVVKSGLAWRDETLDVEGKTRDVERERLEEEKHLLLQGIKELEIDVAAGKVDGRDYEHLRRSAEERAMDIIQALKDDDARWLKEAERHAEKKLGRPLLRKIEREAPPAPSVSGSQEPADAKCFDDRPVAFASGACAACATPHEAEARYCVGCGRPREGLAA